MSLVTSRVIDFLYTVRFHPVFRQVGSYQRLGDVFRIQNGSLEIKRRFEESIFWQHASQYPAFRVELFNPALSETKEITEISNYVIENHHDSFVTIHFNIYGFELTRRENA